MTTTVSLPEAKRRLVLLAKAFPYQVGGSDEKALEREYETLTTTPAHKLIEIYVRSRRCVFGARGRMAPNKHAAEYDLFSIAVSNIELFELIVTGDGLPGSTFSVLGETEHDEHPIFYVQNLVGTVEDLREAGFSVCANIMHHGLLESCGLPTRSSATAAAKFGIPIPRSSSAAGTAGTSGAAATEAAGAAATVPAQNGGSGVPVIECGQPNKKRPCPL